MKIYFEYGPYHGQKIDFPQHKTVPKTMGCVKAAYEKLMVGYYRRYDESAMVWRNMHDSKSEQAICFMKRTHLQEGK